MWTLRLQESFPLRGSILLRLFIPAETLTECCNPFFTSWWTVTQQRHLPWAQLLPGWRPELCVRVCVMLHIENVAQFSSGIYSGLVDWWNFFHFLLLWLCEVFDDPPPFLFQFIPAKIFVRSSWMFQPRSKYLIHLVLCSRSMKIWSNEYLILKFWSGNFQSYLKEFSWRVASIWPWGRGEGRGRMWLGISCRLAAINRNSIWSLLDYVDSAVAVLTLLALTPEMRNELLLETDVIWYFRLIASFSPITDPIHFPHPVLDKSPWSRLVLAHGEWRYQSTLTH